MAERAGGTIWIDWLTELASFDWMDLFYQHLLLALGVLAGQTELLRLTRLTGWTDWLAGLTGWTDWLDVLAGQTGRTDWTCFTSWTGLMLIDKLD